MRIVAERSASVRIHILIFAQVLVQPCARPRAGLVQKALKPKESALLGPERITGQLAWCVPHHGCQRPHGKSMRRHPCLPVSSPRSPDWHALFFLHDVRVAGIFVRFYTLRRSAWLFNAL